MDLSERKVHLVSATSAHRTVCGNRIGEHTLLERDVLRVNCPVCIARLAKKNKAKERS